MRWAVEYELASGTIGLCLFSAENEVAAQAYLTEMQNRYGHTRTFNLQQLTNGVDIKELYRLFPQCRESREFRYGVCGDIFMS